ncbi:uncharacterized protein LOC116265580 [Nymphaea colorata]|nr:uncharacterized protein LOC116265580 [Nymphaea colorata]
MNPQTLRFSTSDTAIPFEKRLRLFPSSRFHVFPVFLCSDVAKSPHFIRSKHGVAAIRNCKDLVSSVSRRIDPISQREVGAPRVGKTVDIATLGNLCVDIVLSVPSLPPTSADEKRAYMEQLSASRPDKKYWEAGGNCNLAIAAARVGLRCLTLGLVGDEIYGRFLVEVLGEEGIGMVKMNEDAETSASNGISYETLRCWVLVDPLQRHGFCSIHDFSKEPAFGWLTMLSGQVKKAIGQSKILFCNGYAYDELSPDLILAALEYARHVETAVFFDPGPRGKKLFCGSPQQQRALKMYLKMSDVLLLTADEAESLTGATNPIRAGQELIRESSHTRWVIIKMGSRGSLLVTKSSVSYAPAFKVDVVDTVGCGDSFTAAVAFGFLQNIPPMNTLVLANAVGGATAMGCGAGRNVASLEKVIELLKASDLNLENFLGEKLVEDDLETDLVILSKSIPNGVGDKIKCVSVEKVVCDLMPRLQIKQKGAMAPL